jgi:pimeloyl-ACP methyl ester carboxylesterase
MLRTLALCLLSLVAGCARIGNLGPGIRGVLSEDARVLDKNDPASAGDTPVIAYGIRITNGPSRFPVVIYRPANQSGPLPSVVFLPARSAPEWMYESYGRALASRGFVVAVRGWYSFFRTDPALARDARQIASWLIDQKLADPERIGIAGHSMGGKSSILAALDDPRFRAVVAMDPDENGRTWVARGPIGRLKAPLLVVGMEVAYKAIRLCATPDGNYRSFFTHAPPGTIEMTLLGADHVQLMDRPDYFGMGICRVGTADSTRVRTITRGAAVRFFERHLLGVAADLPSGTGIVARTKS